MVAVEVKKSRQGVGRWGYVALVLGKDYYCVGIRSVLAWSDNGALLSQGFAAPLFFAWGILSLFSIVVVVVVVFFLFLGSLAGLYFIANILRTE